MTKTIFSLFLITFISAFSAGAQTPTPTPAVIPETIPIPQVQIPPLQTRWNFDDKTAPETEARLKKIPDAQQTPDDIDIRIELIGYYDRKDAPEAKKAVQAHRLWLIRNRPERPYYNELGWWNEGNLNNPDYVALKEEWLKQVNLKKTNDKIRLGAARFLFQNEDALAEKLLKEGQQINPNLYDYSERLIELYEYRVNGAIADYEAAKAGAKESDIDAALRRLFAESEKGLALIAKDEMLARSSDHFELVVRLAGIALDLNELKRARSFAEAVLNEKKDDSGDGWRDTDKAIYYGNALLGRVALREGNTAKAKEHLAASLTFPEDSDFELRELNLDLAAELLAKGEKQAVLDYLARAEKLTTDETNIKIFRRWQRLIKRNSFPYWEGD